MDIASILGIAGGLAALVFSVLSSGGGLGGIWDVPSLIFVIVGSFFAMLLSFPMNRVFAMFKIMGKIFKTPDFGGKALVQNMVALSEKARREGKEDQEKISGADAGEGNGVLGKRDRSK